MRPKNNSGIILIIVVWILVILSLLTLGLARKVKVDLTLTKYAIGKTKSRYIAMAGLMFAIEQIKQDTKDKDSGPVDTKYQCGFSLPEGRTAETVFEKREVGDGYFTVDYRVPTDDGVERSSTKTTGYGLEDEESKVDLNGLNSGNYDILTYLLTEFGFDNVAKSIASSVVDWIDADSEVFNSPSGAEDDEYQGRTIPYRAKNKPMDSIEELMLVKGVTPEIFKKIKNYITVFPRQENLRVNIDTAPTVVLRALARSVTGPQTKTNFSDADSLVDRLVAYRRGDDGQFGTADDRVIDSSAIGLSASETAIFQAISYYRATASNYLHVRVKGVDEGSEVSTRIEAVIQRSNLALLYWHRD